LQQCLPIHCPSTSESLSTDNKIMMETISKKEQNFPMLKISYALLTIIQILTTLDRLTIQQDHKIIF
jgi:hypothetical protein